MGGGKFTASPQPQTLRPTIIAILVTFQTF